MGQTALELMIKIAGRVDPSLGKAMSDAERKAGGMGSKIGKAAKVTAAATFAIGAAAAAGTAIAVKQAATFEEGMNNVKTLLSGSQAEINARGDQLTKQVLQMSNATGKSTEDINEGLYQTISALGDTADSAKILNIAVKAGVAGRSTTIDGINMISAVMKSYNNISTEAAQKASDLAFKTIVLGQTTMPELSQGLQHSASAAHTLNVSQEELYAGFATLTGVTGSTQEVATRLNSLYTQMLKPSDSLQKVVQKMGYSSAYAMVNSLGFGNSIKKLNEAVGGSPVKFAALWSSQEAMTAAVSLAGPSADIYASKLKQLQSAAGATDAAFKQQRDGLKITSEEIKNIGKNFATQIGLKILPYLKNLAQEAVPKVQAASEKALASFDKYAPKIKSGLLQIKSAASWIKDFTQTIQTKVFFQTREMGKSLERLGNTINGKIKKPTGDVSLQIQRILVPAIGMVIKGITGISNAATKAVQWLTKHPEAEAAMRRIGLVALTAVGTFKAFSPAAMKVAGAIGKISAATKMLKSAGMVGGIAKFLGMGPTVLIISAIVAGVAALTIGTIELYKHCTPFRNFVNTVGNGALKAFGAIEITIGKIGKMLGPSISYARSAFKSFGSSMVSTYKTIAPAMEQLLQPIFALAQKIAPYVLPAIKVVGAVIAVIAKTAAKLLIGGLGVAIKSVAASFKLMGIVIKIAARIAAIAIGGLAGGTKSVLTSIAQIVGNIKGIFSGLTMFVKGVFSGNWSQAWHGVVQALGSEFSLIKNVIKAPINAAIGIINGAIGQINKISVTIPSWVPKVGGQTYTPGINPIQPLAKGGIATRPTAALIAEAGESEAVMPLTKLNGLLSSVSKTQARATAMAAVSATGNKIVNIRDYQKGRVDLPDIDGNRKPKNPNNGGSGGNITFAPNITINGSASKEDVEKAVDNEFEKFKKFMARYEKDTRRKNYA